MCPTTATVSEMTKKREDGHRCVCVCDRMHERQLHPHTFDNGSNTGLCKTMRLMCWRFLCKTWTRLQRRQFLLWMIVFGMLVYVVYTQQNMQELSQLFPDQPLNDFQVQPKESLGRQPQAVKQERLPPNVVDADDEDDKSDLRSDLAPATLHILWCGKRHFEFRHYMAMKRADKLIGPDKIFFHYHTLPVMDREGYYLWFNRTLADIDNILLRPLTNSTCPMKGAERFILVLDILERFGGIYIPEDSLLVDFPVHLRSSPLVTGVLAISPEQFQDGLIAGMKGAFKKPLNNEELLIVLNKGRQDDVGIQPCGTIQHYNKEDEDDGHCICVKVSSNIFPKDILEEKTPFGKLARLSAYGWPQWQLEHSVKNSIPRIAHYICLDCQIPFQTFLGMKSAVNVAGLNKVYVHGMKEPSGKWWDKLKQDPRYVYVHREYPETHNDGAKLSEQLAVGMMRVAILLKYGGVYCDDKVLWTGHIPSRYFGFSAVASPDWHQYGDWPDSVNHGVLMAKKNAPYLLKLRGVLHKYRHNEPWFNDHFMAYKIMETHPEMLFLDKHLQVKCLNHNCHPTWQPNYLSRPELNRPGGPFTWQNDTLSIHWADSGPGLTLDSVKYTSGMVVTVSRHILDHSGIGLMQLR